MSIRVYSSKILNILISKKKENILLPRVQPHPDPYATSLAISTANPVSAPAKREPDEIKEERNFGAHLVRSTLPRCAEKLILKMNNLYIVMVKDLRFLTPFCEHYLGREYNRAKSLNMLRLLENEDTRDLLEELDKQNELPIHIDVQLRALLLIHSTTFETFGIRMIAYGNRFADYDDKFFLTLADQNPSDNMNVF